MDDRFFDSSIGDSADHGKITMYAIDRRGKGFDVIAVASVMPGTTNTSKVTTQIDNTPHFISPCGECFADALRVTGAFRNPVANQTEVRAASLAIGSCGVGISSRWVSFTRKISRKRMPESTGWLTDSVIDQLTPCLTWPRAVDCAWAVCASIAIGAVESDTSERRIHPNHVAILAVWDSVGIELGSTQASSDTTTMTINPVDEAAIRYLTRNPHTMRVIAS